MTAGEALAWQVTECGPSAVRVVATGDADPVWKAVHHLAGWLDRPASAEAGVVSIVPAYDSILVELDPLRATPQQVAVLLRSVIASPFPSDSEATNRSFCVPVLYGGEVGPDLDRVAELQGMSADELIARHIERRYTVRCLGAPAGSMMMDAPDLPVPVPRLSSPRPSVPAGAVAVAGLQSVVSPAPSPGGWSVIGRTPLRLLSLDRVPLHPYRPGDRVQFRRIDQTEFGRLEGQDLAAEINEERPADADAAGRMPLGDAAAANSVTSNGAAPTRGAWR